MPESSPVKNQFTAIDIPNRACRLIDNEISSDSTLVRAHIEGIIFIAIIINIILMLH